jgi:hypothetical protein
VGCLLAFNNSGGRVLKKNINISLKGIIIFSLSLLSIGIISMYAALLLINYSQEANDTVPAIVGALGNVVGGLIAGAVAYIVASLQVNSTIDHEGKKSISSSYSILRLIHSELTVNSSIINKFKGDFANGNNMSHLITLSSKNWHNCADRLGTEVRDETVRKLHAFYTKLDVYKEQTDALDESISESLLTSLDEALGFVNEDITQMKANYSD